MGFIDEKFIVALATLVFMMIAFRPMKKGIVGMLDGRINKIKADLEEAAKLRAEAEELLADAKRKLEQSEIDGRLMVARAKEDAEVMMKNAREKMSADIETRKKLAMQKIQSFEENAMNELRKNISQITVSAASQIIEENDNDENFRKSVGSSLDKLSKTFH